MVNTLEVPVSGLTLVAHLAAYGLALAVESEGGEAFMSHAPESLDVEPRIHTTLGLDDVAACVRSSARACEAVVEADLTPGQTGNNRRPVIWARATALDRAEVALARREHLLDVAEQAGDALAAQLMAGLGAPAAWIGGKPHRGASRLDGVMGNHTSDFVRGALRKSRAMAGEVTSSDLGQSGNAAADKTGWSPPGTAVGLAWQWLAGLGLALLPVGLDGVAVARTPAVCVTRPQGVTLPLLGSPVSVARLRGLLQAPSLPAATIGIPPGGAARLRALGVHELVSFPKIDESNAQSVRFHFARGSVTRL